MSKLRFQPSKDFNIGLGKFAKLDKAIIKEVKGAIDTLIENHKLPSKFKDNQLKRELSDYR